MAAALHRYRCATGSLPVAVMFVALGGGSGVRFGYRGGHDPDDKAMAATACGAIGAFGGLTSWVAFACFPVIIPSVIAAMGTVYYGTYYAARAERRATLMNAIREDPGISKRS